MGQSGPLAIDASVFLNAFNPREFGHALSRELLDVLQAKTIPIIAPTLLLPEVAAAVGRGQQDSQLAQAFAATVARWPQLMLLPLDQTLASQAVEVAAVHRLRASDAVYVAVALRFGIPLVSLDQEQLTRAAAMLTTLTPQAALVAVNA